MFNVRYHAYLVMPKIFAMLLICSDWICFQYCMKFNCNLRINGVQEILQSYIWTDRTLKTNYKLNTIIVFDWRIDCDIDYWKILCNEFTSLMFRVNDYFHQLSRNVTLLCNKHFLTNFIFIIMHYWMNGFIKTVQTEY